jgi:hypothetical protein
MPQSIWVGKNIRRWAFWRIGELVRCGLNNLEIWLLNTQGGHIAVSNCDKSDGGCDYDLSSNRLKGVQLFSKRYRRKKTF